MFNPIVFALAILVAVVGAMLNSVTVPALLATLGAHFSAVGGRNVFNPNSYVPIALAGSEIAFKV